MRGERFGYRRKKSSGILAVFPMLFILFFSGVSLAASAPIIIYSPGVMNIPPDTPYPVNVTVTPSRDISAVILHWTFSSSAVHNDSMTFVADGIWHGELPARSDYGYFSYYITAEDATGGVGRFPRTGNLTLYVSDMTLPTIAFDNASIPSFTMGKAVNLTLKAQDNSEVSYVAFYYRYEGDVEWRVQTMNNSGDTYYIVFTPEHSGPMELYFVASDGTNRAYYPSSGAGAPIEVRVSSGGILGLSPLVSALMIIAIALAVVDVFVYLRKKGKAEEAGRKGKEKPSSMDTEAAIFSGNADEEEKNRK